MFIRCLGIVPIHEQGHSNMPQPLFLQQLSQAPAPLLHLLVRRERERRAQAGRGPPRGVEDASGDQGHLGLGELLKGGE